MNIQSVKELAVDGRRVFIRVDFNVPLDDEGQLVDDARIRAALPTIQHVREQGGRVILASHLANPDGGFDARYSMEGVGVRLAELLDTEIMLPDDCISDAARSLVHNLREGQVVLLENLRFHPEERLNDDLFARQLAALADVYVNDAFAAAHRKHASIVGVPKLVPVRGAGLLVERELEQLNRLMARRETPFVAVIGGTKVRDKLTVIGNLMTKVNTLLIGGVLGLVFLKARGIDIGATPLEEERLSIAQRLLERADQLGVELRLPVDHLVVDEVSESAAPRICSNKDIPKNGIVVDIGPQTVELFRRRLVGARKVFWNGPMGRFELTPFASGTEGVARAIAHSGAFCVVGGGDSALAVDRAGLKPFMAHVSTGGGASLAFVEGRELPGIEALKV